MNVAERVKGYYVEDIAYLKQVLEEVPLPDLFQGLRDMLGSSSGDDIARADVFISDVLCRTHPENLEFVKQMGEMGIPLAYCENVFRRNFWARSISISTLTIASDWLPDAKLREGIEFLEKHDPVLLARLVRHWMFRNKWKDWTLPNQLLENPEYLVRWSVLEVLDHILRFPLPEPEVFSPAKTCLAYLQVDNHPLIAEEANFLAKRVSFFEVMPTLTKPEKRKGSKQLEQIAPKLRFESLRYALGHHLHAVNETDFDLKTLHRIVEDLRLA